MLKTLPFVCVPNPPGMGIFIVLSHPSSSSPYIRSLCSQAQTPTRNNNYDYHIN